MEKSMTLHYVYVIVLGFIFITSSFLFVGDFIHMGLCLDTMKECATVLAIGFLFYAVYGLKRFLIPLLWVQFIINGLGTLLSFGFFIAVGAIASTYFGRGDATTVIVVIGFLVSGFNIAFQYLIIAYYKRRRHLLS